jgi:hypothetical protein
MKAITLHAPYSTLLVTRQPCPDGRCLNGVIVGSSAGWGEEPTEPEPLGPCEWCERGPMVKQWHTSDEPCPPELFNQRVAFHQGLSVDATFDSNDWFVQRGGSPGEHELVNWPDGGPPRSVTPLPLDRIVGSGIITESLPILRPDQDPHTAGVPIPADGYVPHIAPTHNGELSWWKGRSETENLSTGRPTWVIENIEHQLPYGDWTPGRWAWQITEAAPTTERCPWCRGYSGWHGQGEERAFYGCPVCDGAGRCDPIPATGKQGWWDWSPT